MDMGSDGTEGVNASSEGPEEGGREQGVLAGGKGVGGRETFRASQVDASDFGIILGVDDRLF
jgi:hypothetical protein